MERPCSRIETITLTQNIYLDILLQKSGKLTFPIQILINTKKKRKIIVDSKHFMFIVFIDPFFYHYTMTHYLQIM